MTGARGLTFDDLRQANMERCGRWHPGFPADETWTGADWSNALGGEAGELAEAALEVVAYAGKVQNTVKKVRRYETGTNTGVDKPLEELYADLDREMADVACYLDLLATKFGRDLAGAIAVKFNEVSERQGFPERLPLPEPVRVEARRRAAEALEEGMRHFAAGSGSIGWGFTAAEMVDVVAPIIEGQVAGAIADRIRRRRFDGLAPDHQRPDDFYTGVLAAEREARGYCQPSTT